MPHIPPSFLSFDKVQNIRLVPTTLSRVPQQQDIFLSFSHLLWKCDDIQSVGAHTPMGIHTQESHVVKSLCTRPLLLHKVSNGSANGLDATITLEHSTMMKTFPSIKGR